MAGHSQFKNIMHRKGAQDAKRAKMFTKIIRELTVAAKVGGSDPESNPRLRSALLSAKTANMPKENIDRAIKRGAGGEDLSNYQEVLYEGYGPSGVAFIVETLTDNRNRTASEIRAAFNKANGALGETNSVSFLFDRRGTLAYPLSLSSELIFDAAISAGAQDISSQETVHQISCLAEDFSKVRDNITHILGEPLEAGLAWIPKSYLSVSEDDAHLILRLIDTLESNDDVQKLWSNYDISEDLLHKLL